MDFLEHSAVDDVVVTGTVLEECRKRNSAAHQRLRALCSSSARRFYVFSNEHHRCVYARIKLWVIDLTGSSLAKDGTAPPPPPPRGPHRGLGHPLTA